MSSVIYWFSATGNSLTTARYLAEKLPDCRLVPVSSLKDAPYVHEDADCVGFVFPVYYSDMPYPVRSLIAKMVFKENAYIFAFTTYRGHFGTIAQRVDQLLKTRGQKLSLSLGIPMPGNSYLNEIHVDEAYLKAQRDNIDPQIGRILSHETADYASCEVLPIRPVDYPNNFRGICADDSCTGCGICMSVCPMENICIRDGKAHIGDACATCLACFHWCPHEAIYMSKEEKIARRRKYRHPDVTIEDIINQKRQ